MDILLCKYRNMKNRLDRTDMKTITIWAIIFTISVILSIFIHTCVILIYIVSVVILFAEYNRFREKNIKKSVSNVVEVMKYEIHDLKNIDIFVGRWRGKRPHMEDEHIVCPSTNIFGVFDGHGGSAASKYIKRRFTAEYEEIFHNLLMNNNYSSIDLLTSDALEKTFIKLDQDIYDRSMDSGAVGVVVKMNSDKIYCTSIGDSEAFIVMNDGTIKKISVTHSLSNHSEYCRYTDTVSPLKPRVGSVLRTHSGLMPTRTIGDHVYKKRDNGLLNIPETTITTVIKSHPVVLDKTKTDHCTNIGDINLVDLAEMIPGSTKLNVTPGFDSKTDPNISLSPETNEQYVRNWKMIILASDGIWDCVEPKEIKNLVQNIMDNHKKKNESKSDLHKNITNFMVKIHSMTVREIDMLDKLLCRYYGDNCTLMIIINNEYRTDD